jgi:hypothetical protein
MTLLGRLLGRGLEVQAHSAARRRHVDLLCLAFSKKHGGRCVAGISVDDGRWVRPVSALPDGTLLAQHYRLADGSEPRLLDVIRIPLDRAQPEPHQPENHVIGGGRWQRVRRADADAGRLAAAAVDRQPLILGTPGDRIPYEDLRASPVDASLTLIRPAQVTFVSTTSYRGYPQSRARFAHDGRPYSLTVTDPHWELEIAGRPDGNYAPASFGLDQKRLLFTISLGEPFEGNCFKLIAAILEAPSVE